MSSDSDFKGWHGMTGPQGEATPFNEAIQGIAEWRRGWVGIDDERIRKQAEMKRLAREEKRKGPELIGPPNPFAGRKTFRPPMKQG